MSDNKRLVFSIIQFFNDQLDSGKLSADSQEGLEVAVQCLETAFHVSADDQSLAVSQTLPEIFSDAVSNKLPAAAAAAPQAKASDTTPPTDQQIAEAEQLKVDGNAQMQAENFSAAVELYSKAIGLSPHNAVYYGNRAAAHGKLGNQAGAVQDCEAAIRIDPKYCKAYGRMGTALTSMNRHTESLHFYKKALELDPGNQTYRSNLAIAQQKVQQQTTPPGPTDGMGGMDFSSLFNSVELRNMATSLMSNPQVSSMMNNPQVSSLMNNPQLQQLVSGITAGAFGPTGAQPGAAEGGAAPTADGGSGQAS